MAKCDKGHKAGPSSNSRKDGENQVFIYHYLGLGRLRQAWGLSAAARSG